MERSEEVLSVADLGRRLRRAVEGVTGREWVEGELGSLKRASSGHVYFTLKDEREEASIDCVIYRFQLQRARRYITDGARVQLMGKGTFWAPRGRLQFVVDRVRPAGRGALLEALERLKLRLAAEGLFASERKRALPHEPRIVGVVTSKSGAAVHDIRSVAFRRGGARLVLAAAQVQGEAAPASIVRALNLIERYPGLSVVIVGRGGGSEDDLMAFNDERVVRRVASFRVPIVSAVGHDIDYTLTDLAADVRAATPSQAAELVIPDDRGRREALLQRRRELSAAVRTRINDDRATLHRLSARLGDPRFLIAERQQQLDELWVRLERATLRGVRRRQQSLELAHRRLSGQHPRAVLFRARAELNPLAERLVAAQKRLLSSSRSRHSRLCGELDALSPLSILARGYAIATTPSGKAIRRPSDVSVGEEFELRVARGSLSARVTALGGEPPESVPE